VVQFLRILAKFFKVRRSPKTLRDVLYTQNSPSSLNRIRCARTMASFVSAFFGVFVGSIARAPGNAAWSDFL
jgi:hypothetical protein